MKILVGYDGSNQSKEALRLSQKHAKGLGAKFEVASAINLNTMIYKVYTDRKRVAYNMQTYSRRTDDNHLTVEFYGYELP